MKNIKRFVLIVLAITVLLSLLTACGNSDITNDYAKLTNKRSLSITNRTGQIIAEVYVYYGEGISIEDMHQVYNEKNPPKGSNESICIDIPKIYDDITTFKVRLINRYGLHYEVVVENVAPKGITEVVITEEDYFPQEGDFWKQVDQFLNGD